MKSFRDYLNEKLQNKEFALEYEKASKAIDFAISLIKRREELGLTQSSLAEITGIKQPMLARIEKGQIPTVPTLHRLAAALVSRIIITGTEMILEEDSTNKNTSSTNKNIPISGKRILEKYAAGSLNYPTALSKEISDIDETNIQYHLEILEEVKKWANLAKSKPEPVRLDPQTILEVTNGESRVKKMNSAFEGLSKNSKLFPHEIKEQKEEENAELALAA